ncbi:MAG: Tetratricopeptide repeat protein [Betaproteobacteria bacterium ADurb.Bin341]|nr:MAG: Tetratricopeptide repeat protein [Betaproteobacteria bacterium ADurb.Bin341]
MRRATALILLSLFLGFLPPAVSAQQAEQEQTNASNASAALAAYREGKQSYDLKDYTTARKKFGEAARLEPTNPRWQYNLGLTYRKLNNFQAARQAFMLARELDPSYKQAEIDEKLQSMGFDPSASASSQPPSRNSEKPGEDRLSQPLIVDRPASTLQDKPTEPVPPVSTETTKDDEDDIISLLIGLFCCFGLPIFIIAGIIIVVRRLTRKPGDQAQPKPSAGKFDPQQLAAEESKLADAAIRLTRVEHAMRLGEHPDLRNLLEHATRNEQAAWKALSKVRNGDRAAFGQLQRMASEAAAASQRAVDLATQIYGDQAFIGQGERIGCFFCARPLANPNYRRRVTLKRGGNQDEVLSCPECAAMTERGESPTIRTGDDGHAHWSEIPNYDPYAMRHGEPHLRQVEAWRYEPQQPMSTLSQLATGGALLGAGALAGAGLAAAASHLFDLDAARQNGLEHDALGEAARQATGRRRSNYDHDHS